MSSKPFRSGKSVSLKPLGPEHAGLLANWLNDPEICGHLSSRVPITTYQAASAIVQMTKASNQFAFAIYNNADQVLGICQVEKIDWVHRNATLGIIIGNRKHWGSGVAVDALALLLDFCFFSLDIFAVTAHVSANNTHALKSAAHFGLEEVGQIRGWNRAHKGGRSDLMIFHIDQKKWESLRNNYVDEVKELTA